MAHHLLDIGSLTKGLESLSGLTGLYFSIYDDRQHQVISPARGDALLSFLKSDKKGQELYNNFIDVNLKLSLKRNQPFMTRGYTEQHHVFIPLRYKEIGLVAVAEAFYASEEDFRNFYVERAYTFGLQERTEEDWLRDMKVISPAELGAKLDDIRSLLENVISCGYEKGEMGRKWRCSKTIVSLMANVHSDLPVKEIQQTLVDAVIFLFNADTAAVFSRKNGCFIPETSAGRHRNVLQGMEIPKENFFLAKAAESKKPVSIMDSHELWFSGFPEEIISMYLFPLASGLGSFGFLAVFNSLLDREAFSATNDLCMLSSYLCGTRVLTEEYEKKFCALGRVSEKLSNLYFHYKEPHLLYEGIVNEAAGLVDAEKCSLMMPEYGEDMLRVFAAKGVSRWLMGDVRVAAGDGIAGKVYEKGEPVLINDAEVIKEYAVMPKPRYKTPSSISLPLKVADEVVGVLNLSDKHSGESFSEKDLAVLTQFASQAAVLVKLCDCHERSEQMRELSITDPLTGLFNRRYFNIRLEEEYQRARRYGLSVSLVMLDIDDFKLFNDTEGHLAGDYILKEISSIMSAAVRANDIVVRFGGEEFVILMPQTSENEALNVSERIRENIKAQIQPTWKKFPKKQMTICAGIAMYPDCGGAKENLIKCADRALYKAKLTGKDCAVLWDGAEEAKDSP